MRTRTSLTLAAAFSALALAAAVVPAAAAAHPEAASPVLTVGSLGGTPVAVGDQLSAPLASGTHANFYSSSTGTSGVTCTTSQFVATDVTNPASPGSATESLGTQNFSGCSSNVTGVTGVQSITVNNLPFTTTVSDSSGFPVTVTAGSTGPIQTTVVLNTLLGSTTCVYTSGPLSGSASNTDNSISFTNQEFTKSSGSSLCFSDAYFTAKYAPVTDTTQGGGKVFVN